MSAKLVNMETIYLPGGCHGIRWWLRTFHLKFVGLGFNAIFLNKYHLYYIHNCNFMKQFLNQTHFMEKKIVKKSIKKTIFFINKLDENNLFLALNEITFPHPPSLSMLSFSRSFTFTDHLSSAFVSSLKFFNVIFSFFNLP